MSRFYTPITHVKLTTVQRDALTAEVGMEIWNTDNSQQEYYNGTVWSASSSSVPDIKSGLMVFVPGAVPTDTKLTLTVAEVAITFATNTPQRVAKAITAPTGNMDYDVRTIVGGTDSSIGTIHFNSNVDTGSFTVTQTSLAVGDIVYILSPSNVYGVSDLFINLVGSSPYPQY